MRNRLSIITKGVIWSLPDIMRPPLRCVYKMVTKIKLVRRVFVKTLNQQECFEYWRNPVPLDYPIEYRNNGQETSEFVLSIFDRYVDKDDKILEIGCNVGRNLNELHSNGYSKLEGIEIYSKAVKLSKQYYKSLALECKIHNVPVEGIIATLPTRKYDVIYSVCVLEHIHYDSDWIFPHMVRIANGLIITIEDEVSISFRTFPRNYKSIFEKLGMVQIEEINCAKIKELSGSCVARVFNRKGN